MKLRQMIQKPKTASEIPSVLFHLDVPSSTITKIDTVDKVAENFTQHGIKALQPKKLGIAPSPLISAKMLGRVKAKRV